MEHFTRIAAQLEQNGLDAVLLTCEANRFYASGFRTPGRDGVALVTRRGNYYFTDSRYTEAAHRAVANAQIEGISAEHPYSERINAVLRSDGVQTLGFEDEYMTVADHVRWSKALKAKLVPATKMLRALREVKDAEEIKRLVAAQRIAERALEEIKNDLREGAAETAIAARLQYLMLTYGAEKMSFDPIVVSGANGSMPHGVPTEKPLRRGEFVTMDFGCVFGGYCSDMTRTFALGEITDEMRKVYEIVLAA
ncbi:MAG: aminopeptidase P family protein, partial [Oscillibacter sp.]|nr:aminopeptidase P family protein [Oscillibacter sp.]